MDEITIKVNTAVLEARAEGAEKQIRTVENRFEEIGEIVNRSVSYWEGEAGDAHRREYAEYLEDVKESLARFRENVTDLRKIAGIYRENEQANTETSNELPTDVII